MKIRQVLFSLFVLFTSTGLYAQDDLLLLLQKEGTPPREKVIATFKGNKIVNAQTNETLQKKNLDFRVNHQFGNISSESGGGIHTFYGLDQSNDIRIAFHYGITDRLTAGLARCKRDENLEALAKYRLLQQTTDHKIPVAVTIFGNTVMTTRASDLIPDFYHRLSYCVQAVIARKFSSSFSLEVIPSYLHRNLVGLKEENDLFSIGAGGRWKFTRSTSLIADYFYSPSLENSLTEHFAPIGIGFEIETGGHVFSLMFTNANGILENDFLVNTTDDWMQGGIKFCFIISRMFRFGKVVKESTP